MPWRACCSLFIDGTVEGDPADLTAYIDDAAGYQLRDHTYYGNGCPSNSITPCSTRIVQTADDDGQKNGTYYHFQAATSGTGGAITVANANSPDTFCPLGWQLPYSGTGGDYYDKPRSWKYLLTKYNIGFDTGTSVDAIKIKSYPFSYVYSGYYLWNTGNLYNQSISGYYWSSSIINSDGAYRPSTWSTGIKPSDAANKAGGYNLRCVTKK
ncbi:hypothetical protein IKF20_02170 [Candidatus Saccharibacteria bacterium]|nr:hypothetical protein [Candidatus Saccharibacteria bacterium]